MIPNYSRVRLITDRLAEEGVAAGTVGYVIETYDDGNYEVEVSDASGATTAQFVARLEDLVIDEPVEMPKALAA